jgi:hypothetical protein
MTTVMPAPSTLAELMHGHGDAIRQGEDWLPVPEAAHYVGLSVRTLKKRDGVLSECQPVGRARVRHYRVSDLDCLKRELLRESRLKATWLPYGVVDKFTLVSFGLTSIEELGSRFPRRLKDRYQQVAVVQCRDADGWDLSLFGKARTVTLLANVLAGATVQPSRYQLTHVAAEGPSAWDPERGPRVHRLNPSA